MARRTSTSRKGEFTPVGELLPKVYQLSTKQRSLLDIALAINEKDAAQANALGFSTRVLVQASLPHRDPGNDLEAWVRTNGNLSLLIRPGMIVKDGAPQKVGYPYGNIPRLLLAYLCTQVIQNKNRTVDLGPSLRQFMIQLGLNPSGGRGGVIPRLKDQLSRLMTANIVFSYSGNEGIAYANRPIAREMRLWWDYKNPEQDQLFSSCVILDEAFFDEIMRNPVPLDMRAIQALRQSSLALDIYTWLTHRVSYLERPVRIPWVALQQQVGSEYSDPKDFKRKVKHALVSIQALWPDLNLGEATGGFIVKPSRPHVRPTTLVPAVKVELKKKGIILG